VSFWKVFGVAVALGQKARIDRLEESVKRQKAERSEPTRRRSGLNEHYLKALEQVRYGEPSATPPRIEGETDPLLSKAVDLCLEQGRISISLLQTHLRVSYGRARDLISDLEEMGIVK